MMKIKVCYTDSWARHMEYLNTGHAGALKRRIVEIELTEEQAAALKPRCIGRDRGKDRFEDVEWCQLEDKTDD